MDFKAKHRKFFKKQSNFQIIFMIFRRKLTEKSMIIDLTLNMSIRSFFTLMVQQNDDHEHQIYNYKHQNYFISIKIIPSASI